MSHRAQPLSRQPDKRLTLPGQVIALYERDNVSGNLVLSWPALFTN
ncbi:hypothetical protein [Erwinia piriflorinigrans]|uniref:Uncharacterized protein n=1 Tax=Erwinia piriflorinigrans CFBP 5888 TaxID=1161919 RepID=V5Z9A2_9GAMM|nr:hypothetical protein [Erwinia piriflorinigrans]CCG87957.1 hypothetical protein EPIR_2594 [Erwinia piriflorinigrans CFBP 5888]